MRVSETDLRVSETDSTIFRMRLTVEIDREADGRWIADMIDLPGVMAYGKSQEEALSSVKALALRVLADKMEHGELSADLPELTFGVAAA